MSVCQCTRFTHIKLLLLLTSTPLPCRQHSTMCCCFQRQAATAHRVLLLVLRRVVAAAERLDKLLYF